MRLMFWNVQRLGASTDNARRTILSSAMYAQAPNFVLLCELTTASQIPQAQNITYRRENPWQLCYGAFDSNAQTIMLTRQNPYAGQGYAGLFDGGNNFANLVDRALAYAGVYNNHHVYVIHSPANQDGAERAITFLTYALNARHNGAYWLVVGDFNVEPQNTSAYVQGHIVNDGATFISGVPKAYDYALTNNTANVTVGSLNPGGLASDHLPIIVTF
jgi:hypothetical protein